MPRRLPLTLLLGAMLALGLLLPRLLHAQGGATGDCPMRSGQSMSMMKDCPMADCPLMRAASRGPDAALEHREDLGLSQAQVTALEALASEIRDQRALISERTREILTPAQSEKLAAVATGGMNMCMQMMGGGGAMDDCPMMGSGRDAGGAGAEKGGF